MKGERPRALYVLAFARGDKIKHSHRMTARGGGLTMCMCAYTNYCRPKRGCGGLPESGCLAGIIRYICSCYDVFRSGYKIIIGAGTHVPPLTMFVYGMKEHLGGVAVLAERDQNLCEG